MRSLLRGDDSIVAEAEEETGLAAPAKGSSATPRPVTATFVNALPATGAGHSRGASKVRGTISASNHGQAAAIAELSLLVKFLWNCQSFLYHCRLISIEYEHFFAAGCFFKFDSSYPSALMKNASNWLCNR